MKISFYTLGCKANQADNQAIQKAATDLGWQIVSFGEKADWVVVSTCAVTRGAEQRSRQMLRAAKKQGAEVIASGCFIEKIKEIDLYLKNPGEVIDYLKNLYSGNHSEPQKSKTRALIRIQDGCNFNCSYCIIHKIRGTSHSRPAQDILIDIKEKEKLGYQEIVLTGINICQYNHNKLNLAKLLKKILDETQIPRIRLGSIDPRLVTDEFIELFKNKKLLPHLHLSLQSGSDKILKLMNRSYTAQDYLGIVERARKIDPLFSFTTDIIVGFPGETDNDIDATIDLIKQVNFTKIHLFPYSKRPGTNAEKLENSVSEDIKKQNFKKLNNAACEVQKNYFKKCDGIIMDVLFEEKKNNAWIGYSPYYFKVKLKRSNNLENRIISTETTLDNILPSQ